MDFLEKYTRALDQCSKDHETNTLACFTHVEGRKYADSMVKLMYVGRAINGADHYWEEGDNAGQCALKAIEFGKNRNLADITSYKPNKADGTPSYTHMKKAFWQVGKKILNDLDVDVTADWANNIIWSNLYKIAPANGGNPSNSLCSAQIDECKSILKLEIDTYKPTHIVIMCGWNWFEDFNSIFNLVPDEENYVVARGNYNNSKIIVCKRPEFKKHQSILKEIAEAFA